MRTTTALAAILLSFVLPITASAEANPEQTVSSILDEIKQAGSSEPILKHVHWETAFQNLSADRKAEMDIKTPAEMKKFYQQAMSNPSAIVRKQLRDKLQGLDERQKAIMEQQMARIDGMVEGMRNEARTKIAQTNYTVNGSMVEGDNATVDITRTRNGETKDEQVELIRIGDRWMLPALQITEEPQSAPKP